MNNVRVHCELWPLVITELGSDMTNADTLGLLALYEGVLARGKPFVGLVDLGSMVRPPCGPQRQLIADWSEEHLDISLRLNMGSAIVVPNGIVRGALTALSWIFRSPIPQSFESGMMPALDWCMQRMADTSLPVPLRVHELRSHHARLSA